MASRSLGASAAARIDLEGLRERKGLRAAKETAIRLKRVFLLLERAC